MAVAAIAVRGSLRVAGSQSERETLPECPRISSAQVAHIFLLPSVAAQCHTAADGTSVILPLTAKESKTAT